MTLMHRNEVHIRPAETSDADGIITVKHAAVFKIGSEIYPPELLASWSGHLDQLHIKKLEDRVAQGSMQFFVALISKTVMGYGGLNLETGEIGGPYIRPDHGREGIGTQILAKLMEEAHERTLPEVFAEVPPNVVSFFTKRGFESKGPSTKTLADGTSLSTVRVEQVIAQ